MAVVGIDAHLVDHLEAFPAPVVDVYQRVVQRRPVFARETVAAAQRLGGGEGVSIDAFRDGAD